MADIDQTMKLARRQVDEHDRLYPGAADNDTTRFARALLEAADLIEQLRSKVEQLEDKLRWL